MKARQQGPASRSGILRRKPRLPLADSAFAISWNNFSAIFASLSVTQAKSFEKGAFDWLNPELIFNLLRTGIEKIWTFWFPM